MRKFISSISPQILLLAIAILAYWQIAFLNSSLKWDAIDVVLPWRYFVGDALQNNYLPMWNPYQQMGYPFFADLQYPFWYIEQLIVGYTIGYSNYTLHFLFILYVWIGGCGMYRLVTNQKISSSIGIWAGAIYMLSGFIVGHVQSFTLIIAAAWIPHVLTQYLKFLKSETLRQLPALALLMFLMVTGGYPALSIITCYLLFILFLNHVFKFILKRNWVSLKSILKQHALLFLVLVGLCGFIVVILLQLQPYVSRFAGVDISFANFNPLSLQSLISFLLPFSIVKDVDRLGTDISMANSFMSISVLMLVVSVLFRKLKAFEWTLLLFGCISLLASLGDATPIRSWLFHYVPFMNLFRFPSIFSYFTLLCFIPLAAIQLQLVEVGKIRRISVITGWLFFILTLLYLVLDHLPSEVFKDIYLAFKNNTLSLSDHIFYHGLIQLFLYAGVLYALLSKNRALFYVLVIVEVFIATQLNISYTGVADTKPRALKASLEKLPEGFPLPYEHSIARNADRSASLYGLDRNTNIFQKQPSFEGYSSFWLGQYDTLFQQYPYLAYSILENPYFYLSDKVFSLKELTDSGRGAGYMNLYFNDVDKSNLKGSMLKHNLSDKIVPKQFTPSEIGFHCSTSESTMLTLLQSNFVGWKAFVDEKETRIFRSNFLYMSIVLPPGEHDVKFIYSNRAFVNALLGSYILAIILLLLLIRMYYLSNRAMGKYLLAGLVTLVLVVVSTLLYRTTTNFKAIRLNKARELFDRVNTAKVISKSETHCILTSTNDEFIKGMQSFDAKGVSMNNLWDSRDIGSLLLTLDTLQVKNVLHVWTNKKMAATHSQAFMLNYPYVTEEYDNGNFGYKLYDKRKPAGISESILDSVWFFEKQDPITSACLEKIDTNQCYEGKGAFRFPSWQEYGPTMKLRPFDHVENDSLLISISCSFLSTSDPEALLVLEVSQQGEQQFWRAEHMGDFMLSANTWNKVFMFQELTWLNPDSELSVYVWNKGKKELLIDQFQVKLLKP